jgi:Cu-Zn family superoxide dismutase
MCSHLNPYNKTHGCPGKKERHVGDLGNIETNSKGEAKYIFYDDDCGASGDDESLKTGNAGKRIACAVIGYSKENF